MLEYQMYLRYGFLHSYHFSKPWHQQQKKKKSFQCLPKSKRTTNLTMEPKCGIQALSLAVLKYSSRILYWHFTSYSQALPQSHYKKFTKQLVSWSFLKHCTLQLYITWKEAHGPAPSSALVCVVLALGLRGPWWNIEPVCSSAIPVHHT